MGPKKSIALAATGLLASGAALTVVLPQERPSPPGQVAALGATVRYESATASRALRAEPLQAMLPVGPAASAKSTATVPGASPDLVSETAATTPSTQAQGSPAARSARAGKAAKTAPSTAAATDRSGASGTAGTEAGGTGVSALSPTGQAGSSNQTARSGPDPGVSPAAKAVGAATGGLGSSSSVTGAASGASQSAGTPTTIPPPDCQTDLALAQSPATDYAFLCTQSGRPLTWATSRITVYSSGLTALQQAGWAVAVLQWETAGHFQVAYTNDPLAADITVVGQDLGRPSPGYTENGYTSVTYRCSPVCRYVAAKIELSTTASLLQTDWVSTILHELGHAAGLNHVAKTDEAMYPVLTLTSPVVYGSGDLAGLAILAAGRPA